MITWTNVTLWNSDGISTNDRETVAIAMNEYRGNGCINGWFLADPADFEDDDDSNALVEAGPSVEEIDFTGLDEYIATLD